MANAEDLNRLRELAMQRLEDGPERRALLSSRPDDLDALPKELLKEDSGPSDETVINIRDMSMAQKIKLAMFGNKAARTTLLRDPNRLIQMFVLDNPRISDNELADIAKNTSVDEAVLRAVAGNTSWMKPYSMKLTICTNPKVPVDVTLKWFKFLTDKDLMNLARSKNIPQVLSTQCRKLYEKRKEKQGARGGE